MPVLDVTWLLPDGAGGGRGARGTVRVPGALPGDRVRYEEVGRSGRTVQGRLVEVVVPSPSRRTPPCPWDAACGGCDLSALDPVARRAALAEVVRRAFSWGGEVQIVPSPRTDYRARIKLALQDGGVGYRAARSHDLVEVGTCAVARPEVQAAIAPLRGRTFDDVASVEIRSDGTRAVYAFQSSRRGAKLPDVPGDVALDGRVIQGDPVLWLGELRASPSSFYQVNLEVNARLVQHVVSEVAAFAPERIADLYAGIGNLSVPLSRLAPVVAVELEGQATADLRAVAPEVKVVTAAVERWDPSAEPFDVAVLDPPRSGAKDVLSRVVRNRPRAIVYVACNPVAAAREIRRTGYRLVSLRAFEMFPDTHHVEAVAVLTR